MNGQGQNTGGFKLIIEDDRQAVWMPINNTFSKSPSGPWDVPIQHGFLIQLGKSRRWPDTDTKMDELLEVAFISGGNEAHPVRTIDKLQLEDPEAVWWVDIRQSKQPAMKPSNVEALGLSPPRSLHKFFIPYPGGITIWPDKSLEIGMAERVPNKGRGETAVEKNHVTYTFELGGSCIVTLCEVNKRQDPQEVNCDEIRIKTSTRKPTPGQTANPPQYP